ncbi:MAG: hypothetical protein DRI46_09285 [Chloroflexi bacterium]|nr:MAG: hypothetical protein DRI46_09285 [Chloroflexota bacterium]
MKLNEKPRNVVTHLPNAQQKFTIDANAKAFQILSSNLYTDKPTAILRELGCNAYDAHKLIGKESIPFDVTLPTEMEPSLSVRDYGPGLSHNGIMGLYTTYFGSDKTHSNEFIGGLGLGSKSPFSYVDTFTVISRQGGVVRTYAAFIDSGGTPNISHLGDANTGTEKDGLEVIVPIKPRDFNKFERTARNVFKYFDVRPYGIEVNPLEEPLLDTNLSFIHKLKGQSEVNHVLMGNVVYRIPDSVELPAVIRKMHFLLYAEVGDLDFQPSREALSLDQRTIDKLDELLEAASKEVAQRIAEKLSSFTDKLQMIKQARKWGLNKTAWKGIDIEIRDSFNIKHLRLDRNRLRSNNWLYASTIEAQHLFVMAIRARYKEILLHNGYDPDNCVFIENPHDAKLLEDYFEWDDPIPSIADLPRPKIDLSFNSRNPVRLKKYTGWYWEDVDYSADEINDMAEPMWVEMKNKDPEFPDLVNCANEMGGVRIIGVPRTLKRLERRMPCPHILEGVQQNIDARFSDDFSLDAYRLWSDNNWIGIGMFTEEKSVEDLTIVRPTLSDFITLHKYTKANTQLFANIRTVVRRGGLKLPTRRTKSCHQMLARFTKTYPVFREIMENADYDTINLNHHRHYVSLVERRRK